MESSGGQRLKERTREAEHPDEDSAAATNQNPDGLCRKTPGTHTHTHTGLSGLTVGLGLTLNVKCCRCLFLIGRVRCIDSNCRRMRRPCTTSSLPSPGNTMMFPIKALKSEWE